MREDEERDHKTLLTPDGRGKADKAIALDRLLTAARRAGAEEMRDKLVALTSANCQGRCVTLPEEVRRAFAALHPDAKGGD